MKFYIKTYGCQMNFFDSDMLIDILVRHGHEYSPRMREDIDLILVNTCAVREKPEKRALSFMERFRERARFFGFGGCVAQKLGKTLFERLTFLNFIFGSYGIDRVPDVLDRLEAGEKGPFDLTGFEGNCFPDRPPYPYHSSGIKAFVKIMEGCNNFCTYCIVPYVRGREVYRPSSEIVDEVKRLVDSGVKEVMLIGQNVNSYRDPKNLNIVFSDLLEMVNNVSGDFWIRYTTSNPKDFGMDMVEAHRDLEKLCNHVHLPLQSGSNKVLKLMGRKYTREEYLEKVMALREAMDISITSDIIVGFPGEDEKDFQETLSAMEEVRFDLVYSFIFSKREGTAACTMEDKTPYDEKRRRLEVLQAFQRKITLESNKRDEGKVFKVLVDGISKKSEKELAGRTAKNKVVNFQGSVKLTGRFVDVKVVEGYANSLRGVME